VERVDAHMHVWRAATGETPGVTTLVPPQTDVTIEAARGVMAQHQIDRAVLVQPVFRGEDNSYVAECARRDPARLAAVCVVDPRIPPCADRLAHWVERGCRGVRLRPAVAEEENAFGDPATFPLWHAAERLAAVVSVLCTPAHLPTIARLAERFPNVPIVVDHLGHPDPTAGIDAPAFRELLALARQMSVFIKLSGVYHFARQPYPFDNCRPLVRAVYEHFGPWRLLWGSDYPHVTVACGYANSLSLVEEMLGDCPAAERQWIMGGNALALYWPM
jgi:L-fuconolactonase